MANDDSIGKEMVPHPGEFDDDPPAQPLVVVQTSALEAMTRADIDLQIATAQKYPRSVAIFKRDVQELVCADKYVAEKCFYKLKRKDRDGKDTFIEGPSIRLAELVASCWGNLRAEARMAEICETYVVAQGRAHDLQKNIAFSAEVRRSIVTRNGKRYSDDMINVTCAAAQAIAMRNAILKVVPPIFFESALRAAKELAAGGKDAKGFVEKRKDLLDRFVKKYGVPLAKLFETLSTDTTPVKGIDDIGQDELETLIGLATALEDGLGTVESIFGVTPGLKGDEGAAKIAAAAVSAATAKKAAKAKEAEAKKDAPPAEPKKEEPTAQPAAKKEEAPPLPAEAKPEVKKEAPPPQQEEPPPPTQPPVQEGEFVAEPPHVDTLGDKADEYEENLTKIRQHCKEAVLLKSVDPLTVVYPLIRALPDGSPEKAETRKLYMDARAELVKMGVLKADGKAAAK